MVPRYWITELSHLVDEQGDLVAGPVARVARFMAAVVEAATARSVVATPQTAVRCFQRPDRRACTGRVLARLVEVPPFVAWRCPACGAEGEIRGWFRTRWDLRYAGRHRDPAPRIPVTLSDLEHDLLRQCDTLDVEMPEVLARATYSEGRVVIEESAPVLWKVLGVLTCEWAGLDTRAARRRFDAVTAPFAAALAAHMPKPARRSAAEPAHPLAALLERARSALEAEPAGEGADALVCELESILGMIRWHARVEPRRAIEGLWELLDCTSRRAARRNEDVLLTAFAAELALAAIETSRLRAGPRRETLRRLLDILQSDRTSRFEFVPQAFASAHLSGSDRQWLRGEALRRLRGPLAARAAGRYRTLLDRVRHAQPRR